MTKTLTEVLGSSRYLPMSHCLTNDGIIIFLYSVAHFSAAILLSVIAYRMWTTYRDRGYYLFPHQLRIVIAIAGLYALSNALEFFLVASGVYRVDLIVRAACVGLLVVLATSSCWRRI